MELGNWQKTGWKPKGVRIAGWECESRSGAKCSGRFHLDMLLGEEVHRGRSCGQNPGMLKWKERPGTLAESSGSSQAYGFARFTSPTFASHLHLSPSPLPGFLDSGQIQ